MSDTSDTSDTGKKPKPIFNPDDVVEPAEPAVDFGAPADPTPADVAIEEPAVEKPATKKPARKPKAEPVVVETEAPAATTTGEVAPVATETPTSEFAGREVVYVQAPIPPKLRGNRGVGSLLAVLGAVLFTVVYGGIMFAVFALGKSPADTFPKFLQNAAFWVPVLLFLVAFVLLVLIVNRGGWAAHVFGSLIVALVVYFGTIGVLLLLDQIAGGDVVHSFSDAALLPFVIIAALVAREVSIWVGLAIAARGRRVKARNLELVDEWEAEHAETKAQYERAGASA